MFQVLNNFDMYHARSVKDWLDEQQTYIEVSSLSSCSGELNSGEMRNANLKAAVTVREQLKDAAIGRLRDFQKWTEKVNQF